MPQSDTLVVEKLEAQFNRAHISQHDFEEAEEYLNEIQNAPSEVVRRALLTSAIIAYARPFTQNERASSAPATSSISNKHLQQLTKEEQVLHERILGLRHEAIAHSPYALRPLQREGLHERGFVVNGTYFDVLSESVDREVFACMCGRLKLACRLQKVELNERLFRLQNAA